MAISPIRTGALAAIAALAFTAPSAPAAAQESGAYYDVTLAQSLEQPRQEIAAGVLWSCAENRCLARKAGSRDAIVCVHLVREIGPVAAFTSGTGALNEKQLERCNKAA